MRSLCTARKKKPVCSREDPTQPKNKMFLKINKYLIKKKKACGMGHIVVDVIGKYDIS